MRRDLISRDQITRELVAAAALALAALALLVLGAPHAVAGLLAVAAVLLGAERLSRLRDLGALDQALVLVGGALVALVLTGMALGVAGVPLRAGTWVVALAVLALAELAISATRPPEPRPPSVRRGDALRLAPWLIVGVLVVVAAVVTSVRSLESVRSVGPARSSASTQAAPLQMSLARIDGTQVRVVVRSGARTGPLELRAAPPGGDEISYPLFTVGAGREVRTTIVLPTSGRYLITLHDPDRAAPLRTLVLDR